MRWWGSSRLPGAVFMDVAPVSSPQQLLAAVPDTASPKWLVENRDLIRSVKSIDASELFGEGRELTFALDRDTKRPVVRVVDPQTEPAAALGGRRAAADSPADETLPDGRRARTGGGSDGGTVP